VGEWLRNGKAHYEKNGNYADVVGAAKGWGPVTIFNAAGLDIPEGLFGPGPPGRKSVKIKLGQTIDYDLLATLLRQAANGL
jgi:hypothetical protein